MVAGMIMILSGADVVLPDRLLSPGTVVLEGHAHHRCNAGLEAGQRRCASGPVQSLHRPRLHRRARARRSMGSTRSRAATRSRRWRGACRGLASPRFARRRLPVRPRALRAMLAAVGAARTRPAPLSARVSAGAPRKQLHQSRIQGRAAARLPAIAARPRARKGSSPARKSSRRLPPRGPTSAS